MQTTPFSIRLHEGARDVLRPLFRIADDAESQITAYIDQGDVLVASDAQVVLLGHVQLVPTDDVHVLELKNIAVLESHQGTGLGRALVRAAIDHARAQHAKTIVVATAAAGVGVLRFYQRLGFRMARIERDAFTKETGYPEGIVIEGIPLCDRVWLDFVL